MYALGDLLDELKDLLKLQNCFPQKGRNKNHHLRHHQRTNEVRKGLKKVYQCDEKSILTIAKLMSENLVL
jgi:hypothetical protein